MNVNVSDDQSPPCVNHEIQQPAWDVTAGVIAPHQHPTHHLPSSSATSIPSVTTAAAGAVSRRSITGVEGGSEHKQPTSVSAPTASSSNRSLIDSIATGGSEGQLCRTFGEDEQLEKGDDANQHFHRQTGELRRHCQPPQPAHYGSTSTTFSTGSSNLTSSSFGGGTLGGLQLQLDQSSVASSSGVATMSSTDHLPLIGGGAQSPPLSRSSADDSTPTMSTLTGGVAVLRRELEPLLSGAASTLASSSGNVLSSAAGAGVAAATAFSSLSLSTAPSTSCSLSTTTGLMASTAAPSTVDVAGAKFDSDFGLLTSRCQAQSTPSLIGALRWKPSSGNDAIGLASSSCNGSMGCGESDPSGGGEGRRESSSPERPSTSQKTTQMTAGILASSSSAQQTMSGQQPQPLSLLATSPLPSVFNCAATSCSQIICTPLRTIVSQNRRRYQMDGFNLDLTYITDRIIAMGYPADTREALYRNSMSHIVKFLEHYHPGHYKVFNLRGQYVYDPANFHNRVVSFEMTDHHPPRLELMAPFCREVHDYLEADPQNVVAVHCKAGKGRTGVMICAYLCYISFYRTPRQNMDYYSIIRTHNNKGVTIPSQRRYVYYFSHLRERRLNYMPLRCELVGVYLERPPKLSGPLSKGALKVRVAVGDVDVFLGDELWLDGEKYEEEEELRKRYPLMTGDDHYDPVRPDPAKNCISRRCYGWTVPENRRVFLEGDIRVDIFQQSQLRLINVKQEKKKVGHIWFNTMFTCPGFCGGHYMHGDEAYPYPESMIVRRRYKRKSQSEHQQQQSKAQQSQDDGSSQSLKHMHVASAPSIVQQQQQDQTSLGQKLANLRLNGGGGGAATAAGRKKRSSRSPCHQLIEADPRSWQSQDGDEERRVKSQLQQRKSHSGGGAGGGRASLDHTVTMSTTATEASEWEDEIVVERPPGLDAHCSEESLKRIFPNEKQAPRHGIEEMIRDAFHRNLINDMYNARRMSQPREGPPIPKAPLGRPNANGPNCVIRNPEEHVNVFGVQEIDRAYKNKDLDSAFKVFIITRCIDESNPKLVSLAEQHVAATRQKQAKKDQEKAEKMEQKQRKMVTNTTTNSLSPAGQHKNQQNQPGQSNFGFSAADSTSQVDQQVSCSSSSIGGDSSCTTSVGSQSQEASSSGGSQPSMQLRKSVEDPRLDDPHLRKYFFRQRVTSKSRHPHIHHHCSLRPPEPNTCAKFGCDGSAEGVQNSAQQRRRSSMGAKRHPPPPTARMEEEEEADEEEDYEREEEEDASFDDFDFFHPRQPTCSTMRGDVEEQRGGGGTGPALDITYNTSSSSSVGTITTTDDQQQQQRNREGGGHGGVQTATHQHLPVVSTSKKFVVQQQPKGSVASSTGAVSSLSSELTETEIFHPSDCSLAPSSNSSCSSSDSLENHHHQQQPQQPGTSAEEQQSHQQHQHHHHPHHYHHNRQHSHRSGGDSGSSRERK